MFIPDPYFYPYRIQDPKTATKERGKKFFYYNFLCSQKFHKIAHYFNFDVMKKIRTNFQTYRTFYPKNCKKLDVSKPYVCKPDVLKPDVL